MGRDPRPAPGLFDIITHYPHMLSAARRHQLRVIFTGPTGVEKNAVLEPLARRALREAGLPEDLSTSEARGFLQYITVEREIVDLMGSRLPGTFERYLDSFNQERQTTLWQQALDRILDRLERERPEHVFLSVHCTFYRNSRFFSPLDWNRLRAFKPDVLVTLIDDVYDVWNRVNQREHRAPAGSYLRLREIAAWRSVEVMVSDLLAQQMYPGKQLPNYVVARKHPPTTLHRLLFCPDSLVVYLSFPISHVRRDPRLRAEIDRFRLRLHERYTVFDPLAIDERILRTLCENRGPDGEVLLRAEERWPVLPEGQGERQDRNYPIHLVAPEVEEVLLDIDRQTVERDYRLIRQSDCLAVYRPQLGGIASTGVHSEMMYAREVATCPVFVCWPPEDGAISQSPFGGFGLKYDGLDDLINALDALQAQKARGATW